MNVAVGTEKIQHVEPQYFLKSNDKSKMIKS